MKLYALKYILLLYGFCACSENEYQQSQNLPESPYETVGRLHNEGLDYVFDELVKSRTLTRSEGKPEIEPCEILELCSDLQSGVTGIPWYIIGMTVGQGIAGSVLVHL